MKNAILQIVMRSVFTKRHNNGRKYLKIITFFGEYRGKKLKLFFFLIQRSANLTVFIGFKNVHPLMLPFSLGNEDGRMDRT